MTMRFQFTLGHGACTDPDDRDDTTRLQFYFVSSKQYPFAPRITKRKLITWCFLLNSPKDPSSLNVFHRSIKIQLTPSDLLAFCFHQILNSAQLAVLRAIFEPAKMVCNQVSKKNDWIIWVLFVWRMIVFFFEIKHTYSCILDIVRVRPPSGMLVL